MDEIVVNLHMHTRYSDGSGSHQEIGRAALRCGLDAVIVTDHNVLARGFEGYIKEGTRKVLMLVGEEIHDQDREPQKNHLLALGAEKELATFADDPQMLIDAVRESGGLSFLAHPDDPAAPAFHQTDISWVDWSVARITGLELWNGFSELKTLLSTRLHGVFYAFFPALIAHCPSPNTLHKWDELLSKGRLVAIGGSDAHANKMHLGPLSRVVFPYEFHFRAINTHVILAHPLTGEAGADKKLLHDSLSAGHCFVGYDLPAPTRGFRFTAQGLEADAIMGDEIPARSGVTLQVRTPAPAEIRLLKDGEVIQAWRNQTIAAHITTEPGVYRIEAYRRYLGRRRGWIFSNPIYVR
ncbi:MAG TPA: CehA/McbA family metallohydrolase [Anaerolineales bacterium]|nr:CehA/McbA family metallohydrolase [Anaerolineales bacterium]